MFLTFLTPVRILYRIHILLRKKIINTYKKKITKVEILNVIKVCNKLLKISVQLLKIVPILFRKYKLDIFKM